MASQCLAAPSLVAFPSGWGADFFHNDSMQQMRNSANLFSYLASPRARTNERALPALSSS